MHVMHWLCHIVLLMIFKYKRIHNDATVKYFYIAKKLLLGTLKVPQVIKYESPDAFNSHTVHYKK